MTLDQAARAAWEAGYIATIERPDISDFMAVLDDCMNVEPRYSANDFEAWQDFEAAEDSRDYLDELGILGSNARQQKQVETALLTHAERAHV